jgi:hypothetical protein
MLKKSEVAILPCYGRLNAAKFRIVRFATPVNPDLVGG